MADLQRATTSEPHGRCISRNARISPTKSLTSFFPPFSCASVRDPAVIVPSVATGQLSRRRESACQGEPLIGKKISLTELGREYRRISWESELPNPPTTL